jgi:hypothetical protein
VRPSTVRMARLMALGSATTGDLTNLAAARDWAPPRTIDHAPPAISRERWHDGGQKIKISEREIGV